MKTRYKEKYEKMAAMDKYSILITVTSKIEASSMKELIEHSHNAIEAMEEAAMLYGYIPDHDAVMGAITEKDDNQ